MLSCRIIIVSTRTQHDNTNCHPYLNGSSANQFRHEHAKLFVNCKIVTRAKGLTEFEFAEEQAISAGRTLTGEGVAKFWTKSLLLRTCAAYLIEDFSEFEGM